MRLYKLVFTMALLQVGLVAHAAYNDAPTISTSGSSTYSTIASTINGWKNAWNPPVNASSTNSAYTNRSAIIDQVEATILAAGKAVITDDEYDVLADALCYWLSQVSREGLPTNHNPAGVYNNSRGGWYINSIDIGTEGAFFGYATSGGADHTSSQCVWELRNTNVLISAAGPMLGPNTRLVLFTNQSSSRIYRSTTSGHTPGNVMFSTNGANSKLIIMGRKNHKISIDGGQSWSDPSSYTQVKDRTTTTAKGQEVVVNSGALLAAYTTFEKNATVYNKGIYHYLTKGSNNAVVDNEVKDYNGGAISMHGTLKACAFYNSSIKNNHLGLGNADGSTADFGGGLAITGVSGASAMTGGIWLNKCTIMGNCCQYGHGGGIASYSDGGDGSTDDRLVFRDTDFKYNCQSSPDEKHGGGLWHRDTNRKCQIYNSNFIGNYAHGLTAGGGGISNEGHLELEGCTFDGNMADNSFGGALYARPYTGDYVLSVSVKGCTFQNNTCTRTSDMASENCELDRGSGGAIMVALVTVHDCTANLVIDGTSSFTGNHADRNGGAIAMTVSSTFQDDLDLASPTATIDANLELKKVTISGNSCGRTGASWTPAGSRYGYGGAIYLSYFNLKVTGSNADVQAYNNSAQEYGGTVGIYKGNVTMSSGTFGIANNPNTAPYGGGFYVNRGTVNFNGGIIASNTASQSGGGVYVQNGNFNMKGGTIGGSATADGNSATAGHGGGVYVATGGICTINGGTIGYNKATNGNGGGFYVDPGASGTTTINSNDANTSISNNTAKNGGGAFINTGTLNVAATNSRTTQVLSNTATINGGGMYANGKVSLTGVNLNGNTAQGSGDANGGGGIYVTGSNNNTISGGTVNGNHATNGNGGGVYVTSGASNTLSITGTTQIDSNDAKKGGGVYVAQGKLSVTGTNASNKAHIESNTADVDGGGVYVAAGSVTASNASVNSNTADSGNGGGIYAVGAVTLTGGSVSSNLATSGKGGGIYAKAGSYTITVQTSAEVNGNEALKGGGIYAESGSVQVTSSTLSGNIADVDGGGVYAEGGAVTMTSATLSSNQADSGDGGGIYGGGGNITVNGGSLATNQADSGNGGGVYATSGTITFNSSSKAIPTFTGNTAQNGGVLFMEGGTCNINAGTLGGSHANRNKAAENGGAIYADNGTVNFATGEISYNTAGLAGGGLYVATDGTLNMTGNVTLDYNHVPSGKHGGGVYLAGVLQIGASTARTISAQYNFADGTVDTDPASVTITPDNRNNVYLPTPVASSSAPHKDVITVVKNGLTTSTRVGFSVPSNFVPVIYCDETSPYTYLRSFLTPIGSGGMKETVFDDASKYVTVHYPDNSFYNPQHIYLSGGTWVDHVTAQPSTGFAVSGDDVTISSNEGLAYLIRYVNGNNADNIAHTGVNVTLAADVDMGDYAWVPMASAGASAYSNDAVFNGTFNGNGYTISNVICQYLGTQTGTNLGLFGTVGNNANLENVQLKDAKINTTNLNDGSTIYLGAIAGQTTGTIRYCIADAELSTLNSGTIMGGLVGQQNGGAIHSSAAIPEMTGYTMGGLVGQLLGGNLYNSFANPKFTYTATTSDYFVGGLVAENHGTIANCYVRLERTQNLGNAKFGMLAGSNTYINNNTSANGDISYCYGPDGTSGQFNHSYTYLYNNVTTGLSDCDLYKKVDAPYLYNRPNNNLVGSTGKTLTEKLNTWVGTNTEYAPWKRTTAGGYATSAHGGNINDDYPIHKMRNSCCAASPNGLFIHYKASLNRMISDYNELGAGTIWLYANPKTAANGDEYINVDNSDNVKLYIDENINLLQDDDNILKAFTCQTLGDYTDPSRGERWHYCSSSLEESYIGFNYGTTGEVQFNWNPNPCNVSFSDNNDAAVFPGDLTSGDITSVDLYAFYEPEYHWINLKRNSNSHWHLNAETVKIEYNGNGTGGNGNETYLVPGKGYLMSIDKEQLLQNWGTLNNGTVTLHDVTYTELNAWAGLLGYNVLGNPYQSYLDFNAFISDENNAALFASKGAKEITYATYDPQFNAYVQYKAGSSVGSRSADGLIHSHQGFLIKRGGGNASADAVFTNDMRNTTGTSPFRSEQPAFPLINLMLTDESGNGDIAVLELERESNEGVEKLRVGDCDAHISLALQQDEFAILFRDKVENYQPLHLTADKAGVYMLTWETANAVFESLTLVDNITGIQTDMLASDSYTFEANPNQYATRFKIVIGDYKDIEEYGEDTSSTGTGTFAFMMGDELIVNGEGRLEMVDMTGRVVLNRDASHAFTISTTGMASGVYMLRLTDGTETKVQKMVIE